MADDATPKTVSIEEFNKVQARAQNFEAKATDYEKRYAGIDPEVVRGKLEDYELLRQEKAKGNPEEIAKLLKDKESELEKRFGKKFEELEGVTKTQSQELKRLRVTSVVMKEAAETFDASTLDLIESVVNRDCDWSDDGIVIKGEDGKPRASSIDPRRSMDVKEYIQGLAAKYEACAKPTAVPGGKQAGTKGAPNLANIKTLSDLSKLPDKGKAALAGMSQQEITALFHK